jgi:AcrR family transcriptional regulator
MLESTMMGRPRTFDQPATLDAIRTQFWETGYAGTSIDDLMNVTGLSKGSLYGAFGAKHEMFVQALAGYCSDAIASLQAQLEGDDAGALARLTQCLRTAAKRAANGTRGCMLTKAIAERAGSDDDVDHLASRGFAAMEKLLAACIVQAQRAGAIAPSLDARASAPLLLAVLRGIDSLGKAGASAATLRRVADAAIAALQPVSPV